MTHKGTQTLHTKRLTLRRFAVEDAQAMFENWASDERVTHYLTWPPHESPEGTRQLLAGWCAAYEKPDAYNWAIEYEGAPVGNISVVRLRDEDESAELGYCLGRAYWNRGLMTEAAQAVIDYLFAEVGVQRVVIGHADGNSASGRVAQKCGFAFEGAKRACYKNAAGECVDVLYYGIFRREWACRR